MPAGWTDDESRLLGLMMLFAFVDFCTLPADADLMGLCLIGSAVLALSASKLSPNKLVDNWLLHALIASWKRLPQLQYDLHVSAKMHDPPFTQRPFVTALDLGCGQQRTQTCTSEACASSPEVQ